MGGKNVGAADVARAASQIVHETGAEPVGYVRSSTGDPPSAFDSYAQTNLNSRNQHSDVNSISVRKEGLRFTAGMLLKWSVWIANPLLYNCLDSLLKGPRIEFLAFGKVLWSTKDLLAHGQVGSNTFSDRHTKSTKH